MTADYHWAIGGPPATITSPPTTVSPMQHLGAISVLSCCIKPSIPSFKYSSLWCMSGSVPVPHIPPCIPLRCLVPRPHPHCIPPSGALVVLLYCQCHHQYTNVHRAQWCTTNTLCTQCTMVHKGCAREDGLHPFSLCSMVQTNASHWTGMGWGRIHIPSDWDPGVKKIVVVGKGVRMYFGWHSDSRCPGSDQKSPAFSRR
mmetsp:Transcript_99095/g.167015  ORF Transcript_99095/g.167015 Transcript_99095/m.167015 type:complete len:200 (+) Transcript_99095:428-1027(+)